MEKKRIALLDTDFLSKTHTCHGSVDHLIDRVLQMPGYEFFCHRQIVIELSRHDLSASAWMENMVQKQFLQIYSDEMILNALEPFLGESCCSMYTQYLYEACETFGRNHFANFYARLDALDLSKVDKTTFLQVLAEADANVGRGNSLGEIKTYVLIQLLQFLEEDRVYLFCSDDSNARAGVVKFPDVRCINVLSTFQLLKSDAGLTKESAEIYFQSLLDFFNRTGNQTTFKVVEAGTQNRFCKVPCTQALRDIYDDKFLLLRNGNLKYK